MATSQTSCSIAAAGVPRAGVGPRHLRILLFAGALFAGALCAGAGACAATSANAPLGFDDARTLLVRTGFGATPKEIADFARLTRSTAVERLLRATVARASTAPPPALSDPALLRYPGRDASDETRKAFRREQIREGLALRAWWLNEMLVTPSPLSERMTLFWHGHFATSQQKVRLTPLMFRQNEVLRAHAVGNFATLLHAVARDPAMLIYLDTVQNRRGHPNENFAREVMELFTLGEGRYSEDDVKEAARAFTGWSLDRTTMQFVNRPRLHDDGPKTVFGHTGNFDGDAVLDLILAREETARAITVELWKEFVSPTPDPREVERMATTFRQSGYDIKTLLRAMFTSDAMYADAARATLVKSPVDVVVGTLHTLGLKPADLRLYAVACAAMGQNLFSPPNVRGWPGGDAWINSETLLRRKQYLERIARAETFGSADAPGMHRDREFDADAWVAQAPAATGADARATALRVLLPLAPVAGDAIGGDVANVVRTALQDATYQLD